ncbi:MAG TPA: hypothetical protein VI911_08070 [Patescibacteria group bacterium]|nr:hypothetical protein [Patescibacteria group bacterium]
MIVLRKVKKTSYIKLAELLIGAQNGINKTFSTPSSFKAGKIIIDYNGQSLYSPDDFVENTDTQITFTVIVPDVTDVLKAHYEVYQ